MLTADKRFTDFFKRAAPDRVRKLFNGTVEENDDQYHGEPEKPRPIASRFYLPGEIL